jgi:hypothetical protein
MLAYPSILLSLQKQKQASCAFMNDMADRHTVHVLFVFSWGKGNRKKELVCSFTVVFMQEPEFMLRAMHVQ